MRQAAPWVLAVVVAAAVYAAAGWYLSEPATFWSSDSAVRFVQLESLRRQGYRALEAVYPAADLDPQHDFYPIPGFSYRRDGRTYLSYPWLFPLVAAPLYGWLGQVGLLVVPALAALAVTGMVAYASARHVPVAGVGAGLLVGVGSPLLIYAVVFWDHSLVAALTAGAVVLLLPGAGNPDRRARAVVAGLLLGLGPWFRNEAYLFAAGVVLGLWVTGRRRLVVWVVAGAALVLLPLWAYHWWWFGHPLGDKGRAVIEGTVQPGLLGYLQSRAIAAYDALLSLEHYERALSPERTVESGLLSLGLVAGAYVLGEGLRRGSRAWLAGGGLVLTCVGAAPALLKLPVMGLLPSAPFVVLAWVRGTGDAQGRFLWTVVGVYVAGFLAVGRPAGLQWGPRYLLPAIPVLGLLCGRSLAAAWRDHARLRGLLVLTLAGLLAGGLAVQVLGLRFIRHSLDTLRAIEDALRSARYEVVATGYEPVFRSLGRLYFEKKLMMVDSQAELRALVALLAERRVRGWTYVPRYPIAFDPRLVERWTEGGPWRFRVEEDRTPLVVQFGGVWPVRLVTYRGTAGPWRTDAPERE